MLEKKGGVNDFQARQKKEFEGNLYESSGNL